MKSVIKIISLGLSTLALNSYANATESFKEASGTSPKGNRVTFALDLESMPESVNETLSPRGSSTPNLQRKVATRNLSMNSSSAVSETHQALSSEEEQTLGTVIGRPYAEVERKPVEPSELDDDSDHSEDDTTQAPVGLSMSGDSSTGEDKKHVSSVEKPKSTKHKSGTRRKRAHSSSSKEASPVITSAKEKDKEEGVKAKRGRSSSKEGSKPSVSKSTAMQLLDESLPQSPSEPPKFISSELVEKSGQVEIRARVPNTGPLTAYPTLSHAAISELLDVKMISKTAQAVGMAGTKLNSGNVVEEKLKVEDPALGEILVGHKLPDQAIPRIKALLLKHPDAFAVLNVDENRRYNTLGETYSSVLGFYNLCVERENGDLVILPSSSFVMTFYREKK